MLRGWRHNKRYSGKSVGRLRGNVCDVMTEGHAAVYTALIQKKLREASTAVIWSLNKQKEDKNEKKKKKKRAANVDN